MAVRGVFSSWDTFAVKSCLALAADRISACCFLMVSTNGLSSLYGVPVLTSSIFSAISSIGLISCFVSICDKAIQMAIMTSMMINISGTVVVDTAHILSASVATLSTVPLSRSVA